MACQIIQEVCKRAGERRAFPAFELVNEFSRLWLPNQSYPAGARVRPSLAIGVTGFEYVSNGGQSGATEPQRRRRSSPWPTVVGESVADGSVVWTAAELSDDSLLYRIGSVSYDVPDGITNHPRDFIDEPGSQRVPMETSGGTLGETYDVVAKVQTVQVGDSAPLYELVLRVSIV